MGRWTKVAFLLSGWMLAQEESPARLVVYDELLDRFFHILHWTPASLSTARPDTVRYLRSEGEVPSLSLYPNLQGLYLSEIEDLDLADLVSLIRRHCPKLRILALEDCDIEDISPLTELPLKGLLLNDNPIANFYPLSRLSGLQFLSLARTPLSDLKWLSSMVGLQGLDISETRITDLTPLANLVQMRMLALYRCTAVKETEPLINFGSLEFLNISFMNPSAVQTLLNNLHHFPRLKVLQAQGAFTEAHKISALAKLPQLEELTLGQNPALSDLDFVRGLRHLLYLDVHRCSIKDLTPLAGLPFLVKLSIGKNQITSIAPLTKCPRLRELYCYDNPITDWEKLLEMPALSYVLISKKDIPSDKLSNLKIQLRKKGVQLDAP
ncbi:MAG: leucine-rich repeat domain-containing protein [Bacteroidia bacterium]|nr:leucine-rich repeat domain-containing protein [Bacteroidia bacterium]